VNQSSNKFKLKRKSPRQNSTNQGQELRTLEAKFPNLKKNGPPQKKKKNGKIKDILL
jgi:hypothetical protein